MRGLNFRLAGLRDWRLSTKLAVLMCAVALAPLALLISQNDSRTRAELTAAQRADLLRAARDSAGRIDNRILERKRQLQTFSSSPMFGRFAAAGDRTGQVAEDARLSLVNLTRTEPVYDSAF